MLPGAEAAKRSRGDWAGRLVMVAQCSMGAYPHEAFFKDAQFQVFEPYGPSAVSHRFQPHVLAFQRRGDIDRLTVPLHPPARSHAALLPFIGVIPRGRQPPRVLFGRRFIVMLRWTLSQRFMGALLVVFVSELFKAPLLRGQRTCRWSCRVFFQRAMEALMTPILLRLSGLNALQLDAQAQPPHTQFAQASQRSGSKGRSVVRADGPRHPILPERADHDGLHYLPPGAGAQPLAAQQITAVSVGQSKRTALVTITRAEPSLEVHTPHRIGLLSVPQRHAAGRGSAPASARKGQTMALQDLADGALRRTMRSSHLALETGQQLGRPPARPLLLQIQEVIHYLLRDGAP